MRVRSSVLCRVLAVIILVGTLAPIGLGQGCPVTIILRVLDKQAQSVVNVTAGQVKAELNGSRADISSFSPAAKTAVILMLDASGSMRGTWNESIAAARELVGRAGEDIEAFVFDEQIQGHAIGHAETEKLLDRWSTETPRHASAIYDTLIEVACRVTTRNAAIVVIGDGYDDASNHTSDATKSLFLRSSWPPVFGLILDYDKSTRPPYSKETSAAFRKVLVATGGLVVYPSSAPKVPAAMEELAATVFTPFALTLQPARPITKGAKLKLEILGADGKPSRDVQALYPVEVAGCDNRSGTPAGQICPSDLATPQSSVQFTVIVTDSTGASIPKANIVFARNGEQMTAQTDLDGMAHLSIPPDQYVVTVSANGFKTAGPTDLLIRHGSPALLRTVLDLAPRQSK